VHTYATRILERTPPVRTTICWRARVIFAGGKLTHFTMMDFFIRPRPPVTINNNATILQYYTAAAVIHCNGV